MESFFFKPVRTSITIVLIAIALTPGLIRISQSVLSQSTLSQVQTETIRRSLPAAYVLASQLSIPFDACPNISGTQSTIPVGKIVDAQGKCVSATGPVYYNTILNDTWDMFPEDIPLQARFMTPAGVVASTKSQQEADWLAKYGYAQSLIVESADTDHCINLNGLQPTVPDGHYWTPDKKCFPIMIEEGCVPLPNPDNNMGDLSAAVYHYCPSGTIFHHTEYYVDEAGARHPALPQEFNKGTNDTITEGPLTLYVTIPPRLFFAGQQEKDFQSNIIGAATYSFFARTYFSPHNVASLINDVRNVGGGSMIPPVARVLLTQIAYASEPKDVGDAQEDIDKIVDGILAMDRDNDGRLSLREINDNLGSMKQVMVGICRARGGTEAQCDKIAGKFNAAGTGINWYTFVFYPIGGTPVVLTKAEAEALRTRMKELVAEADVNHDGVLDAAEQQALQDKLTQQRDDPKLNTILNALCKRIVKKFPQAAERMHLDNKRCDELFPLPEAKKPKVTEEQQQNDR